MIKSNHITIMIKSIMIMLLYKFLSNCESQANSNNLMGAVYVILSEMYPEITQLL